MKNKLLTTLLIFVFAAAIGAVVAEDTADVSDELAIANADETFAVSEDVDDALTEDEEEQALQDDEEIEPLGEAADGDAKDLTSIGIRVDVLDKNIKAGDEFKVKITVSNWGDYSADDVVAGFSFTDLAGNPDGGVKLVDDGGYAVTPVDGGYVVEFGFMDAGETQQIILTFLATESGEKMIFASVDSDNSIMEPDNYFNTTFTVGEGQNSNSADNKNKVSSAKMLATGNPLALLGLALCCFVPYFRRR